MGLSAHLSKLVLTVGLAAVATAICTAMTSSASGTGTQSALEGEPVALNPDAQAQRARFHEAGTEVEPAPQLPARRSGGDVGSALLEGPWPVPGPPTVRSDFYDLRFLSRENRWVLHGGLDIAVDERHWRRGAPVRAVAKGQVWSIATIRRCSVIRVGRFGYGHVTPRADLQVGSTVQAGERIGTSCPGDWHIHLTEWRTTGGCQVGLEECRINPLRPGGLLRLNETWAPEITEVDRTDDGELIARIEDRVADGFFDAELEPLIVRHLPYQVFVNETLVFEKLANRSAAEDVFHGVGTETRRNVKAEECLGPGITGMRACDGVYWLRLGNGESCRYGCWLRAVDAAGNATRQWVVATPETAHLGS